MGRPRAFEQQDVLRKAGAQFWLKGYQVGEQGDLGSRVDRQDCCLSTQYR
jgi:hypothetical protein